MTFFSVLLFSTLKVTECKGQLVIALFKKGKLEDVYCGNNKNNSLTKLLFHLRGQKLTCSTFLFFTSQELK